MLEIQNINKVYDAGSVNENAIFNDFSLSIDKGQFVSIIGSNGSGKTTLLNIICGSIPIDSGHILLEGVPIGRKPEYQRARSIGRVYQNPATGTCAHLSIWENMSLADNKNKHFGLSRGVNRKRRDDYREMLADLGMGLENRMDQPCGTLSGGQRQALALIMSTLTPIDLLILDEHTAALDPSGSQRVMEITDRLVKRHQLTTLMVTHNLRFAMDYGDRLLMMHEGGILIDRAGAEKATLELDEILDRFNQISIEYGN